MQCSKTSYRLGIGLCGLVLISAYCLFDLLDIDGSSLCRTNDMTLVAAEDARGEDANGWGEDPLPAVPTVPAPERATARLSGMLKRYGLVARSQTRAATAPDSRSSSREADPA